MVTSLEGSQASTQTVFVTLDIRTLYTNIPHEEGREVIEGILESRSDKFPPTFFLLELLDIILENNYFCRGDEFYLQHCGVVMRSPAAPSITNLFMDSFEKTYILSVNPFRSDIIIWRRYIDDIFVFLQIPPLLIGL